MSDTAIEKRPPDVGSMVMDPKFKAQLQAALPRHMTPDRMARIVLTEMRKNPELTRCDPMSLLGAVIQCSQLGLEPGNGLGHAFLIPRYNSKRKCKEVTFLPGAKGLVDLARRSGRVLELKARCVYEKDQFNFEQGDDERIVHVPFQGSKKDRGGIVAVYAIAHLVGGGKEREVMYKADVDWVRDNYGNSNPVWKDHYDEMARKTVLRKICKYLPLSPEMHRALEADDKASTGESQDNHMALVDLGVIDADYTPAEPVSEDATTPAAMNAQGAAANEARTHTDLKAQFVTAVGKAAKTRTIGEIYERLGIAAGFDINKFATEQLVNFLELLKNLETPK